jgi:hypothetical protein
LPTASDFIDRDIQQFYDFAICDDREAMEVFGQTGKYFGRENNQPHKVSNFSISMILQNIVPHQITGKRRNHVNGGTVPIAISGWKAVDLKCLNCVLFLTEYESGKLYEKQEN